MNEPILDKAEPHGYDNKPLTWGEFLKIKEVSQKVANATGYPVYLVGSALHKEAPRDIDISIIIPQKDYKKMFSGVIKIFKKGECTIGELMWVVDNTMHNKHTELFDLQFCVDYHVDIKICPDNWWVDKPKMLLAEVQDE